MTAQDRAENPPAFDTAAATDTPAPVLSYRGAHSRVQAARGHATSYRCDDCGGPAFDWSYGHSDPAELVALVNGKPLRYSADSDQYLPRCRPCHRRFDAAQRTLRIFATW